MLHFASKVCRPRAQPDLLSPIPHPNSAAFFLPRQAGADGLEAGRQASKALKALLKDKMTDPNVRNPYTDMTPLHCAAFFGFAEGVKVRLTRLSTLTCKQNTVSWSASGPRLLTGALHPHCRQLLLETKKVDLAARCHSLEGATALHLATLAGSEEGVAHLLAAGASCAATDDHKRTPQQLASFMRGQHEPDTEQGKTEGICGRRSPS
jgi:ankyrin repeat protein